MRRRLALIVLALSFGGCASVEDGRVMLPLNAGTPVTTWWVNVQ